MSSPAPEIKPLTYGDYLGWKDDKRWELIDGTAYLMAPAPTGGIGSWQERSSVRSPTNSPVSSFGYDSLYRLTGSTRRRRTSASFAMRFAKSRWKYR
jgi:hypothetical protein